MAEVVFEHIVRADAHLSLTVNVSSAGTANWHVGKPMDPRARGALDRAGFTHAGSPAAFADTGYLDSLDLIVVMTREHRHDVNERRSKRDQSVLLLRSIIDAQHDLDLADPYYGDASDFDECLATIIRSCQELALTLRPGGARFEA